MQKGFKEGLLEILKGHKDLWKSVSKVSENDLKNFRSNLKSSEDFLKSIEDASEREIEFKTLSENFNEDQLEAE